MISIDYSTGVEDEEYSDVAIYVINSVAKKRKQLLSLPNYDYPPSFDWQKNHIAIESIGRGTYSVQMYSY